MTAVRHRTLSTPIGTLMIVCSDRGVVATIFDDEDRDLELARIERWFGQRPAATAWGRGPRRSRRRPSARRAATSPVGHEPLGTA